MADEIALIDGQSTHGQQGVSPTGEIRNIKTNEAGDQVAGVRTDDTASIMAVLLRDLVPVEGTEQDATDRKSLVIPIESSHDQQVLVELFGRHEVAGDDHALQSITLPIGNVTLAVDAFTLTDGWPLIRLRATALIAPTVGALNAFLIRRT